MKKLRRIKKIFWNLVEQEISNTAEAYRLYTGCDDKTPREWAERNVKITV